MASGLSNGVVPRDLNDTSSIPSLERLDSETFATLVTEVISRLSARTPEGVPESNSAAPFYAEFCSLVRKRANEPAIISAVSGIVSRPVQSGDDLYLVLGALCHVVCELPEDQILPYHQALVALSDTESGVISDRAHEAFLVPQARDLLRFVDKRDEVWVPERKGDLMGLRSLQERVQTARDMRPYVHDLLRWLQDTNWPNYSACEEQLARFPEIAVRPIQKILKDHRGDGPWINNLLQFVQLRVPVGRSWEVMYPQVKALIDAPQGDEDECETADRAKEWLAVLNRWRSSQEGLRCA